MLNTNNHQFTIRIREEISDGFADIHTEVRGELDEEMFDELLSAIERVARNFEKGEK